MYKIYQFVMNLPGRTDGKEDTKNKIYVNGKLKIKQELK